MTNDGIKETSEIEGSRWKAQTANPASKKADVMLHLIVEEVVVVTLIPRIDENQSRSNLREQLNQKPRKDQITVDTHQTMLISGHVVTKAVITNLDLTGLPTPITLTIRMSINAPKGMITFNKSIHMKTMVLTANLTLNITAARGAGRMSRLRGLKNPDARKMTLLQR